MVHGMLSDIKNNKSDLPHYSTYCGMFLSYLIQKKTSCPVESQLQGPYSLSSDTFWLMLKNVHYRFEIKSFKCIVIHYCFYSIRPVNLGTFPLASYSQFCASIP